MSRSKKSCCALSHSRPDCSWVAYKKGRKIAIQTVKDFKTQVDSEIEVIFNVFKDIDYKIYRELLGTD